MRCWKRRTTPSFKQDGGLRAAITALRPLYVYVSLAPLLFAYFLFPRRESKESCIFLLHVLASLRSISSRFPLPDVFLLKLRIHLRPLPSGPGHCADAPRPTTTCPPTGCSDTPPPDGQRPRSRRRIPPRAPAHTQNAPDAAAPARTGACRSAWNPAPGTPASPAPLLSPTPHPAAVRSHRLG